MGEPNDVNTMLAEVEDFANQLDQCTAAEGGVEPPTAAASDRTPPVAAPSTAPASSGNLQRILAIRVPNIVRLAERTMVMRSVLQLTPGSVIEFEKPADEPLTLLANDRCIGHGTAVKVGENFGLRVTQIAPVKDKVDALGPH